MNRKRHKLASSHKIIPRRFTKRKGATLSEILPAAAYRRRIKELQRNNRELACALQDAKCVAAVNTMMLQNYTKDSNNILMARHKIKDMASTIQKLVGDLHDVLNCLDVCHLTSIRPTLNTDAVRLRILEPDLETIEESPRSSIGGNEEELMNGPLVSRISLSEWREMAETPSLALDTSATEIYNVNQFLSNNLEMQKDLHSIREDEVDAVIQTPPPPQFDPPSYTSKVVDSASEKIKDIALSTQESTSKVSTNTHLSKIPVRRPNLFQDSGVHDSPEVFIPSLRRETFVVNQPHNIDNNCVPASDKPLIAHDKDTGYVPASSRRGTYTLQELANELQARKKDSDRRGTFVIPLLPPPKPANFELPREICTDDRTVLLSEDMDLTEIIPSSAFQGASKMQFSGLCLPQTNANIGNSTILPSILHTCKKSVKASKKSVMSNSSEQIFNQQNLIDDTVPGTYDTEVIDKRKDSFSGTSRKSILAKISESSSSCSFSDVLPSDPEPEASLEVPRKRIPNRRSLKPNRRGPFIFKNNTKSRKSISKPNNPDLIGSKNYDFSSSEEDDEVIKKSKSGRKLSKKSSKMKKVKNTVEVLERDIGLMYQEQGRRKRSLKRKVSFANINVTPTNSDCENKADNDTKEANAPIRRSILKINPLPTCSNEKDSISPESSFSSQDDCEQNSSSKSTFEIKLCASGSKGKSRSTSDKETTLSSSEKSNCKTANKNGATDNEKDTKSKEIQKRTNKVENCMGSGLKAADKEIDDKPIVDENESPGDPVIASSYVKKSGSKSSLKSKETNLPKLSNIKSHKNSEFFGFENKGSKSKRTFSGVSERSSKKRITATDDFLEEVDIVLPTESKQNEVSISAMMNLNDDKLLKNREEDFLEEVDIVLPIKSKKIQNDDNLKNTAAVDFLEEVDVESKDEVSTYPSKGSNNIIEDIDKLQMNGDINDVNIDSVFGDCKNDTPFSTPSRVLNNIAQNTVERLANPSNDFFLDEDNAVPSTGKKKIAVSVSALKIIPKTENTLNTKTPKPKKASNARVKKKPKSQIAFDVLTEVRDSLNCKQRNSKKVFKENLKDRDSSPPPSKARKTNSAGSSKENIMVPDLESGGRSRRNRPTINFKEPSLHTKMRRE